ncbi:peptidylprolyl isomerase [Algivirga pacifica]|uniref:peptidylprolyl isomerase n=1 Tax=Algivirga pacifica TaxID=1162670 RepID=A0ABP9DHJ7_9BACT
MRTTYYNIFLLVFILLFSCEKPQETDSSNVTQQKTVTKKKKKNNRKLQRLHNGNVVSELTWYGEENPETKVKIITSFGDIIIKLYEDTPLHRANFIMLVKKGYFNDSQFYRVMKGFVVQGGDSDDFQFANRKKRIGKYTIPAEINAKKHFHKRGAVSLARSIKNNPEKRSSSFDFYITVGAKRDRAYMEALEAESPGIQYSPEMIQAYKTLGGEPGLDGDFTVFGEVIEGMDVVEKITTVEVSEEDNWPLESIYIKAEIIE